VFSKSGWIVNKRRKHLKAVQIDSLLVSDLKKEIHRDMENRSGGGGLLVPSTTASVADMAE
jgi:hypothetical protein